MRIAILSFFIVALLFVSASGQVVEKFYREGKWGFKTSLPTSWGTEKVAPQFDLISILQEGYFIVEKDHKSGYYDSTGVERIPLIYDNAHLFYDGLAAVKKDNKWGFIDYTGTVIVPFIYDYTDWFSYGRAHVEQQGKSGFINKTGKVVIPIIYGYASAFSNEGTVVVQQNSKWGIIDTSGKIIVPVIYESAEDFTNGKAIVTLKGRRYEIDRSNHKNLINDLPEKKDLKTPVTASAGETVVSEDTQLGLQVIQKEGSFGLRRKEGKVLVYPVCSRVTIINLSYSQEVEIILGSGSESRKWRLPVSDLNDPNNLQSYIKCYTCEGKGKVKETETTGDETITTYHTERNATTVYNPKTKSSDMVRTERQVATTRRTPGKTASKKTECWRCKGSGKLPVTIVWTVSRYKSDLE